MCPRWSQIWLKLIEIHMFSLSTMPVPAKLLKLRYQGEILIKLHYLHLTMLYPLLMWTSWIFKYLCNFAHTMKIATRIFLAGLYSDLVTPLTHETVVPASNGISRSLYRRGLWLPGWAYWRNFPACRTCPCPCPCRNNGAPVTVGMVSHAHWGNFWFNHSSLHHQ